MRILAICGTMLLGGCATPLPQYSGIVLSQSFTVVGEGSGAICTGRYDRSESETEISAALICHDGRTGKITIRTNPDGHPMLGTASLVDGSTAHVVFQPLLADRHAHGRASDLKAPSKSFIATQEQKREAAQRALYSAPSEYRTYYRGPRGGCYYINSSGGKTYVDRSMCR